MMFIAKVKSAVLITAACVVVTGTGIVVAQQATKADKDAPVQQAPALTRAPLIAAAPPATNPAQAAPVLRAPALTRDQLIAAADQEASKAWPQHKPNVRAPGFFIPRKPDGCLRDIKVEPQAGLWQVSVVVRLFVAGKENRIGSVSVPLDANGALAGAVQFEGFEGRDGAPAPKTGTTESKPAAPAPAVNEYLAQQTAQLWVNGLLAGRVDRILAVSDVPFGWDKVAVVKTAEELKTKFEGVSKTKGVRNLQAGEATLLKDAEAAAVADRFQLLDTPGLVYVLVKIPNPEKSRGFDPVLLAIKPGNQLKVVGFAD